ncbi:MAG TPA: DUF1161 domain-containing protein [Terriglobales bacterium]|nr:DUF1161 domain-containing protein [Terriglobales bacterium]
MIKRIVVTAAALAMAASSCAFAQAAKPCEELKSEIAQKIEANGVKSYSLEIVEKEKDAQGKVVGTCDGGTKKIVYSKTSGNQNQQEAANNKPSAQENKQ